MKHKETWYEDKVWEQMTPHICYVNFEYYYMSWYKRALKKPNIPESKFMLDNYFPNAKMIARANKADKSE